MKTVLLIVAALVMGIALGLLFCGATIKNLRRQLKALRAGKSAESIFRSVTRFIFVTTQVFALVWVSTSYAIAAYSTVVLMQPFPVTELSQQAIITLLGMAGMKVVENIFEHNEGAVFGRSKQEDVPPPESGDEKGAG